MFDLDGVLYRYDKAGRVAWMARLAGLATGELQRLWLDSGWEDEAEAGAYASGADYLAAFDALVGASIGVERWIAVRRAAMEPRADVFDIAMALAERHDMAVLTNNAQLLKEHVDQIAPELAPVFGRHVYVSAEFKVRKPAAEAFRRCMGVFGAEPAETVFVDDSKANVDGAARLGIAAVHYRPGTDLREEEAVRRLLGE